MLLGASVVLCVWVAWINGKGGRGSLLVLVPSPSLFLLLWSGWRVSNPLPPPWEGGAHPVELHPQCAPRLFACVCFLRVVRSRSLVLLALRGLERMAGVEPAASTLGGWRSGLLSYIRMSRRTVLLVAFVAWARGTGACLYQCR